MNHTTLENIKEIAEQLDWGFRAFIHKTTAQLLFVPDDNRFSDMDTEAWEEELEELENNFSAYDEIDKWTSRESFQIMNDFAGHLTDPLLRSQLFDALSKSKPFRQFKYVIDNSGDIREQWFDFKNKREQDYVARQLQRLMETNQDDVSNE